MGTQLSKESQESQDKIGSYENFKSILDFIATNYILTMDFQSMKNLSKKEYCDKLVVLTSDIIEHYLTSKNIDYLEQKIVSGEEKNVMTQANIIYFSKDKLDEYDVKNDTKKSIRKKRICIGIAKFYVKIAHIYSALLTTINPVYEYKTPEGQTMTTSLLEKDKIPVNVEKKILLL